MKYNYIFFLMLLCNVTFSQVNLTSSLTACYALNNNLTEPINNLNGTNYNVTGAPDRFNNANSAMSFAGTTSSYVELPNSPLLKPNAISISGWFKPAQVQACMDIIYTKNIYSSFFTAYDLTVQNNGSGPKFRLYRQNGGGSNFVESTTPATANTWYHIAFSIDNANMKIYINGVLENTSVATITSFNYDPTRFVILGGTNEMAVNNPYSGLMDNIRFYNRVINASEVAALYTQDPSCTVQTLPPVASFSASAINICAGSSVAFTDGSTNNPTSWAWQFNGASATVAAVTNPTITFNTPGTYTASLVSSNSAGASNTATIAITVNAIPTLTVSSNAGTICIGKQATLTVSGATSYSWSNSVITATNAVSPLLTTVYTATGTSNGCKSSKSYTLTVANLPTIMATATKTLFCRGVTTTLTASGGVTYTWSTGQTVGSFTAAPQQHTTYTVTGSNSNGCIKSAVITVSVQVCAGLSESSSLLSIKLFPNPSKDFVTISGMAAVEEISLTDHTGKILFNMQLKGANENILDLNSYAPGVYFVTITGAGEGTTLKLIKE